MSQTGQCPKCGRPLSAAVPEGLCPHCLLRSVVGKRPPAPPTDLPPPLAGLSRCVGDYELLQEIGRGGMGVVYKARQAKLGREVALKLMLLGQMAGEKAKERVRHEAQIAARLQHPNIVAVYDVGEHEGAPYIAMEYVEGRTLDQMAKVSAFKPGEAAELIRSLALAIHYAHQQGIVHRDLKPANVMIDSANRPRIADFGLAKHLESDLGLTVSGETFGTPSFMSPEQAKPTRGQIGPATDVYSLGGILYYLLSGRPPFCADTRDEVLRQAVHDEPVAPRRLNPSIPPDLQTICLKCLEKEPHRRYTSAEELAEDLGRWARGEPIIASPANWIIRVVKWYRRKPIVAGLSAALIAVFLIGFGATLWQWQQAVRAALSEKEAKIQANAKEKDAVNAREKAEEQLQRSEELLYASQIALALREWHNGNVGLAWHHLESCRWDLRGWEHDYLTTLMTKGHRTLLGGHVGAVNSLSLSPNGLRLASCGNDECLKIWDLSRGQDIITIRDGKPRGAVAFSPDGRYIAVAGLNCLEVIDATTGKRLALIDTGSIERLVYSPDGRHLATIAVDAKRPKVWDTSTWAEAVALSEDSVTGAKDGWDAWDLAMSVAWSPDGHRIVSGSKIGTLKLWDATIGKKLLTINAHEADVDCVAFSPDSKRILSGAFDGSLKMCASDTGQELLSVKGHTSGVTSVAFSSNGQHFVSASRDTTLKLWDAKTGSALSVLKGHTDRVTCVSFTPDGKQVVSGSEDGTVRLWKTTGEDNPLVLWSTSHRVKLLTSGAEGQLIAGLNEETVERDRFISMIKETPTLWDARTGRQLMEFRVDNSNSQYKGSVTCIGISCDGKRLAAGNSWGAVTLWNANTGKREMTVSGDNEIVPEITCVTFSPDGRRLAGASSYNTKLWDVTSGHEIMSLKGARAPAFSSNPSWMAVVATSTRTDSDDFSDVKVLDTETGQEISRLAGYSAVKSMVFSPDGRQIVSGYSDNSMCLWDVASSRKLLTLKGHTAPVTCIAFSPDGRRILSGSADRTLRIWNAKTGIETVALEGHSSALQRIIFSSDGRRIISGDEDGTLSVWDGTTRSESRALMGNIGAPTSVAFSPDGRSIICGTGGWLLFMWDATTGREMRTFYGHGTGVNGVAFSPDGQRIASGDDHTLIVWEAATSRKIFTRNADSNWVESIAFSSDGNYLATGGQGFVLLREATTGNIVATLKSGVGRVSSIAFSADSRFLASAAGDGSVRLWRVATRQEVWAISAHESAAICIAFSGDGRTLASSSYASVKLWDPMTGRALRTLVGHSDWVHGVAFSPDSQRIVSGSSDGTVRLWSRDTGEQISVFRENSIVWSIAVSPDGKLIISGSDSGVKVWDATALIP